MKTVCRHCGQATAAADVPAGTCPHCGQPLNHPEAADGRLGVSPALDQAPPIAASDPLAQFVVFDREGDPVREPLTRAGRSTHLRPATSASLGSRVAVPRSVLYLQGILLAVVALVFLLLGVLIGRRLQPPSDPAAALPKPCVVSGQVLYLDRAKRRTPDVAAVVLVLPVNSLPQEKASPYGLRPADEPPEDNHAGLRSVREIGGDLGRTDHEGRYELLVSSSQPHFLLVISSRIRRQKEKMAKRDLAQIGSYFLAAAELIGRNKYVWKEIASIGGSRQRLQPVVFP